MNSFIYGYYGFGNSGDQLLLNSVVDHINDWQLQPKFIVRSSLNKRISDSMIFIELDNDFSNSNISPLNKFGSFIKKSVKYLKKSDVLIFGGGTLFQSKSGKFPTSLFLIFLLCLIAKLLKKPIFALGVGVSFSHNISSRLLMQFIVLLTKDFSVRDDTSFTNINRLLFSKKVRSTADLVYSSLPTIITQDDMKLSKELAFTLAASDNKLTCNHKARLADEFNALIKYNLCSESPMPMTFIVFQEFGDELSDERMFFNMIREEYRQYIKVESCPDSIDVALSLFKRFSLVIGMRFHGLVLASMTMTPFIGVSVDHKVHDLCKDFNMNNFNLFCPNNNLVDLTKSALSKPFPNDKLEDNIRRSNENFSVLEQYMRSV